MSGSPGVGGSGASGSKRNGGSFMDDLLSTDNLLAQTKKQPSMRDMKFSSTSSSAAAGAGGTGGGRTGGDFNNYQSNNNISGLDSFASSPSTMHADDLDAFFSTKTQAQTQTTTSSRIQITKNNGVHQNDSFLDELAAFASTPAPPTKSSSHAFDQRANASEVKASSTSATTNSSIDDLFGLSSDAQSSSSPSIAERTKTHMTKESQPAQYQRANEEVGAQKSENEPQRSKMKENSNGITTESSRKAARNNSEDGEDRRANFGKSAATFSSSPVSRVQPHQHAQKLASSVKLESLKTGIDSVAGFFKAGIRRAVGPQVVHFPRAPLEDSAPELKQAPPKDNRSETREAGKQNDKIATTKRFNGEVVLAEKFKSTVQVTAEETRTKTRNGNDENKKDKNNQKEEEEKKKKVQDDLSSSDMDAFFGSVGARSVDSSASNSHIDLESMFNSSSNAPKSKGAPPPVADDFFGTSVDGGCPSGSSAIKTEGAFEYKPESDDEQDGDTEERTRLRKQRHERNRARIEQALEEKRARERQAIEERAERQTLQDLIGSDIDEWGKKYGGNVRTMLANLSEVLWEGHAYKVPSMMDLMEPIKVKKSYHRALVIIHPDKVAQKGGGASQRFIADKVFDLMKDAYRDFERKELS